MKFTSPVFSAVSGSIGGTTFAHNRGGMYTRARATPTNPNSTRQQIARAAFNAAINAWSETLTDVQRAAWNNYAANTPVTNKLGQTVHLSGQNMFVRNYAFGMQPEIAAIMSPSQAAPTTFDTGPTVWRWAPQSGGQNYEIGLANGEATLSNDVIFTQPAPVNGVLAMFTGPPQNAGVTFYKGPYRLTYAQLITATDTEVTQAATQGSQASGYPNWTDGDRVPVRYRILWADGRLSQPVEMISTVFEEEP